MVRSVNFSGLYSLFLIVTMDTLKIFCYWEFAVGWSRVPATTHDSSKSFKIFSKNIAHSYLSEFHDLMIYDSKDIFINVSSLMCYF